MSENRPFLVVGDVANVSQLLGLDENASNLQLDVVPTLSDAEERIKSVSYRAVLIDPSLYSPDENFTHTMIVKEHPDLSTADESSQGLLSDPLAELILEQITDAFICLDKDWRFAFVNSKAERILDCKRTDIIGKQFCEIFPEIADDSSDKICRKAMTKQEGTQFQAYLAPKNQWLDVRVFPSKDSLSLYFQDITSQKKSESRIAKLNQCLLEFGSDARENINKLIELCAELLDARCAVYNYVAGSTPALKASWNIDDESLFLDIFEDRICRLLIKKGQDDIALIRNLHKSAFMKKNDSLVRYDLRSCIGKVVKHRGRNLGLLCLGFSSDFRPTKEDKELLSIITSAIGVEEKRWEAEEALLSTRNRLQHFLAMTPAVIYCCKAGKVKGAVFISENVSEIIGYKPSDFIDSPILWDTSLHPDDKERVLSGISDIYNKGYYIDEYRLRHKDGSYRWIRDEVRLIKDNNGNPLETIGCWIDITDLKIIQEELWVSRSKAEQNSSEMKALIASISDGVSLLGKNGNLLWINDAGRVILGVDKDYDFLNWDTSFKRYTLDGKPIEISQIPVIKALNGEISSNERYKIVSPSGKETYISISASPIFNISGNVVGVTNIFRDITHEINQERQRHEVYQREHYISETLQRALIPEIAMNFNGFKVSAGYRSAYTEAQVGGDFYDVFETDDGRLGIVVGDVSGKGLQAAVHTAMAKYSLRAYAHENPEPRYVLEKLNSSICHSTPDELFVTLFYGLLDPKTCVLEYSNAGHDLPLLFRNNAESVHQLKTTGKIAGIFPNMKFEQRDVQLSNGDVLLVYTDGITDARQNLNFFGINGLSDTLKQIASEKEDNIINLVFKAALDASGGSLKDDAAVVVVKACLDYK